MSDRSRPLVAAFIALALLAAAAAVGWFTEWQRANEAERRVDELEDEADQLRSRLDRPDGSAAPVPADPLDGLLDGLLDGDGALGDLLTGGIPGAACMTPAGGALDGLLGGSADPLPEDPDALVEVVAEQVAELRALEWDHEVEVAFVDDAELSERLDGLLEQDVDREALAAEHRLLAALGAVPDDLDLEQVQRELLDEQVAGYYVPETGELVVRVPEDGTIRPLDRVTLAHELEHALADQALGLPEAAHDPDPQDADARLGALALIEGDATLLMNLWALEHLSLTEQLAGAMSGDLAAAQASLAAIPHHLQRELLFPYTDGLDYVCELYLDGGWAAVDARYEDPPDTSVEVLHPERDGQAAQTPPPLTAPAGGQQLLQTTFGAAPLLWLFEAPGGDPARGLADARGRVADWAGGTVTAWDLEGRTAVGISLVDGGGEGGLCEAMTAWHDGAFEDHRRQDAEGARVFVGQDSTAVLRCEDDEVRYALAPDLPAALVIVAPQGP
jgi:hypothetical protein